MTSTWRSKINACNIIQRNLIRQIYKYTIKKYIQIHNKECTEISPRDSSFAQWGSSDESRDHCAAKIQHIDIPRQYESQLRQQSTRKHRMVNDVKLQRRRHSPCDVFACSADVVGFHIVLVYQCVVFSPRSDLVTRLMSPIGRNSCHEERSLCILCCVFVYISLWCICIFV